MGSAPYVASSFSHILIGRLQAIFLSTQAALELRDSSIEMNVYSVESQPHGVAMWPIVPTTVLERQTDRAEDLLMIQRWDQAREWRYQTIQALCLLMEVHDRSNQLLSSLATRSAPSLQGENMGIVGQVMLTAEDVPPLVTDEDDDLTDRDAEGSMDEGED